MLAFCSLRRRKSLIGCVAASPAVKDAAVSAHTRDRFAGACFRSAPSKALPGTVPTRRATGFHSDAQSTWIRLRSAHILARRWRVVLAKRSGIMGKLTAHKKRPPSEPLVSFPVRASLGADAFHSWDHCSCFCGHGGVSAPLDVSWPGPASVARAAASRGSRRVYDCAFNNRGHSRRPCDSGVKK